MLGLSANLNYYPFNGNVDLRNADSKMLYIGCWTHCRRLWVDEKGCELYVKPMEIPEKYP